MTNNENILTAFVRHIGYALEPFGVASSSPELTINYLANLGWEFTSVPASISSLGVTVREITDAVQTNDDLFALIPKIKKLFGDIDALEHSTDLNAQAKAELPRQLAEHIIADYLLTSAPTIGGFLLALGIIRVTEIPAQSGRLPFQRKTIALSDLTMLVGEPLNFFKQTFAWGNTFFRGGDILNGVALVLDGYGFEASFSTPSAPPLNHIFANSTNSQTEFINSLFVTLYRNELSNEREGFGLEIVLTPETSTDKPGFAVSPFFYGSIAEEFSIAATEQLKIESSLSASGGIWLLLRPGKDIAIKKLDDTSPSDVSGLINATLINKETQPTVLLGSTSASHLEIGAISTTTGLRINSQNKSELFAEFHIQQGKIIVKSSDGDSLIAKILPPDGITVPFDLIIGFSDTRGMYIDGGAGFEYTFQVNKQLGPIVINTVDLSLFADTEGIKLITAVTGGAEIGPFTAVVEKIGLKTNVIFGKPGLLGKADLDFGFKLPTAIGMSIKTSGLSGGGFIEIDPPNYAGMLTISYENKFDITAFCLICTRYENKDMLSLFVQVMAQFSPIQLGMGFALTGVGGMFAYNRGLNLDALKAVAKDHSLDNLMFPPAPIKDAAKIFDAIRNVYPIREGHNTFAFFGKFIWGGSVKIVEFNLGIVVPLGGDVVIVILGTAKSRLPSEDNVLLRLNMDVLGILDFGNETISIDMSLYDSKIKQIDLNGQMALRASWARGSKNFAMSAGGWYPRFRFIPSGFPSLRRMSGSLEKSGFHLSLNSYFAVTSNTLQHGTDFELRGSKSGFDIRGSAGYDVILIFSPFSFECVVYFRVRVEKDWIGTSVDLEFNFRGPNPYHVDGYAKFSVCHKSFKISFTKEWGDGTSDPLPVISPKTRLKEELVNPKSFKFELPPAIASGLIFTEGAEGKADPVADIIISQSVVPLDYTMTRFGGGRPPESEKHLVISVTSGSDYKESFAVEQFNNWTKDQKLSAQPYEDLNGGKVCSGSYVSWSNSTGQWPQRQIEYETVLRESNNYRPPNGKAKKEYVLLKRRTIFSSGNAKYLRSWSKFGSGFYHKPPVQTLPKGATPFVSLEKEMFTAGGQTSVNGKIVRHQVGGVAAKNMTFSEATNYVSQFNEPLVIVNIVQTQ